MHLVLLVYYSVAIVAASVIGGLLPDWIRLTHRRTEMVVSLVAGAMLGVALLHMLPHAMASAVADSDNLVAAITAVLRWVVIGFLAMFFIERFFCFHHHDMPEEEDGEEGHAGHHHGCTEHDHPHTDHSPGLTWSGAAMGLTLHSVLAGVALAASVRHAPEGAAAAGLGAFVAIVLHKPLDAMTISMLMGRGGWSASARSLVNALFALAVPLGIATFYAGVGTMEEAGVSEPISAALALSAGVFLCVAMSDLLPELHFHHHDRLKLSLALLAGLAVADIACRFESHTHPQAPEAEETALLGANDPAQPAERNAFQPM